MTKEISAPNLLLATFPTRVMKLIESSNSISQKEMGASVIFKFEEVQIHCTCPLNTV